MMSISNYLVPAERIQRELVVAKSRFIARLAPVKDVEEARAFIAEMRDKYVKASHNVPAYLIGGGNNIYDFCSDDGEPSGTAGRPALAVLHGSGLGDVAVVITRYFGGTLLGKGGLVKAYTEATQMVVNNVRRARRQQVQVARLSVPYNLLERIRLILPKHGGEIVKEIFLEDITMTIQFPVENIDGLLMEIREISAGKLDLEPIETTEILLPI